TALPPSLALITEGPRPDRLAQPIHSLQKRSTQFCAAHAGFILSCGSSTCSGDVTFACGSNSFCASTSDAISALWGCFASNGFCNFGSTACMPYTSQSSSTKVYGNSTLSW